MVTYQKLFLKRNAMVCNVGKFYLYGKMYEYSLKFSR